MSNTKLQRSFNFTLRQPKQLPITRRYKKHLLALRKKEFGIALKKHIEDLEEEFEWHQKKLARRKNKEGRGLDNFCKDQGHDWYVVRRWDDKRDIHDMVYPTEERLYKCWLERCHVCGNEKEKSYRI